MTKLLIALRDTPLTSPFGERGIQGDFHTLNKHVKGQQKTKSFYNSATIMSSSLVPSPLMGEGQGEGEIIARFNQDFYNSATIISFNLRLGT